MSRVYQLFPCGHWTEHESRFTPPDCPTLILKQKYPCGRKECLRFFPSVVLPTGTDPFYEADCQDQAEGEREPEPARREGDARGEP